MTSVSSVTLRRFDQHTEDPKRIYNLYERVYGDSAAIRQRWVWEFISHPRAEEIVILIAEQNGNPVGMTVRTPVVMCVNGLERPASFASNSLVDPDFRGRGIIRQLYDLASASGSLQLSKGTAEGMYRVLKQIGYRDIVPDTFQVCLIDPVTWALRRSGIKKKERRSFGLGDWTDDQFHEISLVDADVQSIVDRADHDGIKKDVLYLKWRYFAIPHKQYRVFIRKLAGVAVSLVVLRISNSTAYLVDLIWDSVVHDEPGSSIIFSKKVARRLGACKMIAWASLAELRTTLKKNYFIDQGRTPHFSWYCSGWEKDLLDWSGIHVVHGDGDLEYL